MVRPSLYPHLQLGVDFFGQGNCEVRKRSKNKARFVKHGGYLGALGAYMNDYEKELS